MSNISIASLRIVKSLPSLTIGVTSACFVIGLLIVNMRLSWYGIYPQEFVHTEYVLVGSVFIFLTAIAYASFIYSKRDFRRVFQEAKQKHLGSAFLSLFSGLIALFGPLFIIFSALFHFISFSAVFSFVYLILLGSLVNDCAEDIGKIIMATKSISDAGINERIAPTNRLIGKAISIVIFLGFYANFTYPHIPTAFGGGNKSPIILHPNERGLALSKALALPIHENPAIVGPLKLLTESKDEIVILVPDTLTGRSQAVRLNRNLFDAIQTVTPSVPDGWGVGYDT